MENFILSALLALGIVTTAVGPTEQMLPQAPPAVTAAPPAASASAKTDKPAVSILSINQSGPSSQPAQLPQQQPNKEANKPLLTFSVISDIHVESDDSQSHTKFKAALNDLNQVNPNADALVINGDLTNGLPEDYDRLGKLINQLPHPNNTLYTIGNHEFYKAWYNAKNQWNLNTFPNGETEKASVDRFLQFARQSSVYYDQTIKGYHFIFLGSERYRQSDPSNSESAYLTPEQLSWLKQTLKNGADPQKPIFVFLHQPLPNSVAGTNYFANLRAVVQYEELQAILSEYPQVVFFSGHTHWNLKMDKTLVKAKFTMVNSSSVNEPLTLDPNGAEVAIGAQNSEGLYVTVYPERVAIQGRDFYKKEWISQAQFSVPITVK